MDYQNLGKEDEGGYNRVAKSLEKPAFIFIFLFLLWGFWDVYRHPTGIVKGEVYKIEETGDTVELYYKYQVAPNVVNYSTLIALKDTLNLKLNTVGEYNIIYYKGNTSKSTLVVKK
jgi:hypothetical protein